MASSNSRCASSKKNTSLGFSRSPASGSSSNSSASSHISAVENSFGLSCTPGSSRHEITPRPSSARPQQVGDRELRLAEELVPPPSSRPTSERSSTPTVAPGQPADALELGLALVGVEERQQRPQVGEVDERQPLRVRVVEDEPEALLLRLVGAEDLGQQLRPEVRHRRAHRHARADPAEREVLGGEARAARTEGRARPGASPPPCRPRPAPPCRTGRPSRRRRTRARRPPTAPRRAAAACASCRCRSRPPPARGGSSSPAGCGPARPGAARRRARRGPARSPGRRWRSPRRPPRRSRP